MGLVTLTFDLLTPKLVCESHQRLGTFVPNLGMPGIWVLELFAMYATDGWTKILTNATFIALRSAPIASINFMRRFHGGSQGMKDV